MVLDAVKAMPAGSKPPAAVGVRISKGERHKFGAAAPLSTRALSLEQERVEGPVESSPMLVRHIRPGSTLFTEQLSPRFAGTAAAALRRLRVLVSDGTSASIARRGCLEAY